MTAHELRDQIRQAFPAAPFYGPITICDCDECTNFRKELRHKRWDEISNAFLDFTCNPVLLEPEAFNAFLPAYLFRALDDLNPHSVVAEMTVYSLCPAEGQYPIFPASVNRLLALGQAESPEQIQVIRAFLLFVEENISDAQWFRSTISLALERVWQ